MVLVRCLSITSADSFIILSGIPSGPVAFLGFRRLISIFISSFFASGKLYEHFFLIWLILGWCLWFAWPLGLPNACGGCPQVVSTIFISCEFEVSATSTSSFLSRHFSFNVVTSSFLTFLFVRNGDIEFQKLLLVKRLVFSRFCKIWFFSCLF